MGPQSFGHSVLAFGDGHAVPGENEENMRRFDAVGNIALKYRPDTILCGGDIFDLPSLASYLEKKADGSTGQTAYSEGKRIGMDIDAGKNALERVLRPVISYNKRRSKQGRLQLQYKPRLVFLMGNHEDRLARYAVENPKSSDIINLTLITDWIQKQGWELFFSDETFWFEGIGSKHFFESGSMGRPVQITQAKRQLARSSVWFHSHKYATDERRQGNIVDRFTVVPCLKPDHRLKAGETNGLLFLNDCENGNYAINEIPYKRLMASYSHPDIR